MYKENLAIENFIDITLVPSEKTTNLHLLSPA